MSAQEIQFAFGNRLFNMEQFDEEGLIVRLRNGEHSLLTDLFDFHRDRLWRMVSFRLDRRLIGRVDADDVLQEVYLDVAQRLEHYLDGPSMSFFVWLRLVTGQTLINVHRRHLGSQKRDAGREQQRYSPSTSISLASQLLGEFTSPSQAALREEQSVELESAINQMDPIDREVLALRHFEELSNGEVAEVLGLKVKAASIRYVRAIKRLKEILEGNDIFSEHVSPDKNT